MVRLRRPAAALCAALLAALVLAACGSSSTKTATTPPTVPAPSGSVADFPAVKGKNLQDIQRNLTDGPIFAPSVSLLGPDTRPLPPLGQRIAVAADRAFAFAYAAVLDGWLAGVTTFDGGDGLAAVKGQLGS